MTAPRQPKNATARAANTVKKKIDVNEIKKQIQKQGDDLIAFVEEELKSAP